MKDGFIKILVVVILISVFLTAFYYTNNQDSGDIIYNNSSDQTTEDESSGFGKGNDGKKPPKIDYDDDYFDDDYYDDDYYDDWWWQDDDEWWQEDEMVSSDWEPNIPDENSSEDTAPPPPTSSGGENISTPEVDDDSVIKADVVEIANELARDYSMQINLPSLDNQPIDVKKQTKSTLQQMKSTMIQIDTKLVQGINKNGVKMLINLVLDNPITTRSVAYTMSIYDHVESSLYSFYIALSDQVLIRKGVYNSCIKKYTELNPKDFVYGKPNPSYVTSRHFVNMMAQRSLHDDRYNTYISYLLWEKQDKNMDINYVMYNKYLLIMDDLKKYVY